MLHNEYILKEYIRSAIELKILDYLIQHNGEAYINALSRDLKIPKKVIFKLALNSLYFAVSRRKGIIYLKNHNLLTTLIYLRSVLNYNIEESSLKLIERILNFVAKNEDILERMKHDGETL